MWNKLKYNFGLDYMYTHFYKLNHDKDETIQFTCMMFLLFMQQQKPQYTTKKSKNVVIFIYREGLHVPENTVYFIFCLNRHTNVHRLLHCKCFLLCHVACILIVFKIHQIFLLARDWSKCIM